MGVAPEIEDSIITVGLEDPALVEAGALTKRLERLARGMDRPFGLLLDLTATAQAPAATMDALLQSILTEMPSHGLRGIGIVSSNPEMVNEGNDVLLAADASSFIGFFVSIGEAKRFLHGIDEIAPGETTEVPR